MTDIQISRQDGGRAGRDPCGEIKTLFAALCGGGGHNNAHTMPFPGADKVDGGRIEDGDVLISFLGHRGRRSQSVPKREFPPYERMARLLYEQITL